MARLTRRNFLKLAAASGAVVVAGGGFENEALAGDIMTQTGRDFSPTTKKERKAIPSTCWSCVTRDPMIGFVEDGKLVKLEGHPKSIRTEGFICSKGQAGVNHVYDPDRILHPMKRVGKRGSGKWKRISWDAALTELVGKIEPLRKAGKPEQFAFHYGRMKASASKHIKGLFLNAYGTKTIGNHTSICEGGKWSSQELTWGGHFDNWDIDNTKFMLNFGSNILETHTNHMPVAHRISRAQVDRGVRLVTFDVRLSNTAAKSDEWIPIKPGTDQAVILAMCNVILNKGWYKGEGEKFMKFVKATKNHADSVKTKIAALKKHCAKYTPKWAEGISGVSASKIEALAKEFAHAKPACLITYRGAVAHYNGNETERAAQMLASITGNVDNPGGRCKAVGAGWKYPHGPKAPKSAGLKINDGFPKGHPGHASFPTHHMSHQTLKMIKDGRAGRPDVYLWYCYTPAYANGDVQENIDILKDEKLLPYTVAVDPFYGDSAVFADLILPDATYLERWDWEDMVDPNQIGEWSIRQPMVKPLGEVRDFADVCCELADRMGFPLGVSSKEEFVQKSCDMTPGVKEAGGFAYMKKHGVWNPGGKGKFYSYKNEIKDVSGATYDEETGVYWKPKNDKEKKKGYTWAKKSYKNYVGQKIGNKVYQVFKPDAVNKSGYMELYSILMEKAGWPPMPTYMVAPEHKSMGSKDLILTTFKVSVQTHSRTQNCKWLTEIYHENKAWINPKTAKARGIKTDDTIKITSDAGAFEIRANVTEKITPGVVAVSHHLGHWAYGRYASGKKAPGAGGAHDNDPDLKNIHWSRHGTHPNWAIPNTPDPINGQQRWMDTVVRVSKT